MATLETMKIERHILEAINNAVADMIAEEEARAVERVRVRIREAAAGICASATKNITFERMGLDLVIRLRDDREKA